MWLSEFALALRSLRQNLTFTLTAGLMIAAATGAVTMMFAVTNSVLLRPLPYRDPDSLVALYGDFRTRDIFASLFSNENFADIANGTKAEFEELAALRTGRMLLTRPDGASEEVRYGVATANVFRTLGAGIALGRDFNETDGQPQIGEGSAHANQLNMVIISHEFWRRRYGADPGILGESLDRDPGSDDRVVGILKPGFELLFSPTDNIEIRPDVWFAGRLVYDNANRTQLFLRPIARLRKGVSVERAQAAVDSVVTRIRQNYAITGLYARVEPMHKALVSQVRPAMLALMGSVIFLLLIACANVLNLQLVRASLRAREMAVRLALGSGAWPLLRASMAEALVLTAGGTAAGVVLARLSLQRLIDMAPVTLPRFEAIRIDPAVLAVTAAVAFAAAVAFGLATLGGGLRGDFMKLLRGNSRTAGLSGSGGRLRNGVVVVEIALCFALLIASGLMFRSFLKLQRIDPGFDSRGLLTFKVLGGQGASPERRAAQARQIEARLHAIPGVRSVTASERMPLGDGYTVTRWGMEAALADRTKYRPVDWQVVRPGYFETLRTPLLEGRTFTEADNDPARNFAIVDQFLAAKAFPAGSAVGKRILTRIRTPGPEWVEVIGVVAHQRVTSLAEPGREQIYFTDGLVGFGRANRWTIRTGGDPAAYAAAVRAEMKILDPKLLVAEIQPMEALVRRAQGGTIFSLTLIGGFASIAVLLVAAGLYGVLTTVVRQRTAEIGVRMALGATPSSILRLVVGYALRLSAAGVVLGMLAAVGFARAMTTMLVGIEPTDPITFGATAVLFVAIAAVSSWLPARRAANLNPVIALRDE